jgi:hypothetical protein
MPPDVQRTYQQVEATWHELASRAIRVLLVWQGMTYRDAASALAEIGVQESARSLEGKIHRGTFSFTFLLQILVATKSHCPVQWREALAKQQSWEHRASSIVQSDLAAQRWLTYNVLSRHLRDIGVIVSPTRLHYKFRQGTLSTALFLQYATVRRLEIISGWVDWDSMNEAAARGGRLFEAGGPMTVEAPVPHAHPPAPFSNPAARRWAWRRWLAPR